MVLLNNALTHSESCDEISLINGGNVVLLVVSNSYATTEMQTTDRICVFCRQRKGNRKYEIDKFRKELYTILSPKLTITFYERRYTLNRIANKKSSQQHNSEMHIAKSVK